MRLTLPHYYDFGTDRRIVGADLGRPEAWDALRTQTSGPFAMAHDRREWERQADERPEIGERAQAIAALAAGRGARRLASYGVGGAVAELWLHRAQPELELVVTDYTPEAVARLVELFPEAEVRRHDLLAEAPLEADLHLFHRIDTEFTNAQWREVLKRFADRTVLVVVADLLQGRRVPGHLRSLLRVRRGTRAGWLRNRHALEDLFRRTHVATPLRTHDLSAWILEPRGVAPA